MRSIHHPGPIHLERIQCIPARVRMADICLPAHSQLLDGITRAVREHAASGAVFCLQGGHLQPLSFVIPALAQDDAPHVAWYSQTFASPGPAAVQAGCITWGLRAAQPWLHSHAAWQDASGKRQCGHLLPDACRVHEALHLKAWFVHGAGFVVDFDAETRFDLFQPQKAPAQDVANSRPAVALRLRPNQDFCLALERFCAQNGITHARICGGVGSLIGAEFTDGRRVEPFATETFITQGRIALDASGQPHCTAAVTSIDYLGQMHSGTLLRGHNPVLITFELVLEIVETA